MDRIDLIIKTGLGFSGSVISWMVGGLGLAFTVLIALMAFDFISGLMVGWVKKELSSSVGKAGFIKKLYIVLLIGGVYLIELAVLKSNGIVGDGIAVAYCIIEFISLVENGGKLGVPIGPLKNVVSVLKNQQVKERK